MGLKTFLRTTVVTLIIVGGTQALAQTSAQTALPDLSADTIARDAQVRLVGGQSVTLLPTFDPFEASGEFAGTAALRESRGEVDRTGARLPEGAVLDLNVIYTSASDDPYDLRGIEEAVFLSGDFIPSVAYDSRTLECSSRVTDVVYRDDYYAGVSHGLIAGLFMAYPRYRGHRHYHYDLGPRHYRRAGRRAYRHGGYRGGYRGGYSRRGYGGYHDGGHRDGDYRRGDRERRRGDRRRDRDRDGVRDGGRRGDGVRRDRRRESDRPTLGTRRGTGVGRPRGVLPDTPPAVGTGRTGVVERRTPRTDRRRPLIATPDTPVIRPDRPARRSTPSPRPRTPEPRPLADSTPRRSSPTPSRPSRPERSSGSSRSARPTRSRTAPKRVDRATDRAFGKGRPARSHDYYPAGTRVETVTEGRCAKEESLALFIPAERLEAARFDGLTVILLSTQGEEIPVFVPPNYVEGYLQATRR